MCGIAGIVDASRTREQFGPLLKRMTDVISHRGPDDAGFFADDGIGLGMRRLSIIDIAGGKQPVYNEDNRFVVVFNGEIYGYEELRAQLRAKGHRFRAEGDTEVIVHLYEEYGQDCVQHLRGMFAFALWDKAARKLLVARDRLGIKPLYYAAQSGGLVFASEIKSIVQDTRFQAKLNPAALSHYLSLKFVPAPDTLFEGIHSLPPGHLLTFQGGSLAIRKYWDFSFGQNSGAESEDDLVDALDERLRECVRMRLRSDVSFGAFLSGGVDSSLIVGMMSRELNRPVKTFSVGFQSDGDEKDELPYAGIVAQRFGTDHHEIRVGPADLINNLSKVVWHLDQPIADQATVATYMLSQMASRHVKMVLSGEGGDELFAGYARYSAERLAPLFALAPAALKLAVIRATDRAVGLRRPKIAIYALMQSDENRRLVSWFPLFNHDAKQELLRGTSLAGGIEQSTDEVVAAQLTHTDARDPLSRMLYADTKLWLPDYLLLRGDKLTMAASLEARVPLLDHKLVEFAASVSSRMKIRGLTRKHLLKRVAQRYLPDDIVKRPKKGFPIPVFRWLQNEGRELVRDHLTEQTIRKRGLYNPAPVEHLLNRFEQGESQFGPHVLGLLSIELWHRLFVDASVPSQ